MNQHKGSTLDKLFKNLSRAEYTVSKLSTLQLDEVFKNLPTDTWNKAKEQLWNDFIYSGYYDQYLRSKGYVSVYDDLFGTDVILDTTMFRGVVDFIYYKKDKLKIKSPAKIVNSPPVMVANKEFGKNETATKYNARLSDHFPIWVEFEKIEVGV